MMKTNLLAYLLLGSLIVSGGLAVFPDQPLASPEATGLLAPAVAAGRYAITLEPVVDGLVAPNWGAAAPIHPNRLFVSDQAGQIWAVDLGANTKTLFLDLSSRLVSLGIGGPGTFDERGLLGFAFHPDYNTNGLLYTLASETNAGPADFSTIPSGETANHQAVLLEWKVGNPLDPASVVDPGSAREVLRVDEPQFNHNGGALNFGPDGMLYIALGDGGGADDQGMGHGSSGNAQDLATVLGALLRIDPTARDSSNGQYGIPADNPFVGDAGKLGEVYAYGFRNPFRFSFDTLTGDLHLGDVGQNDLEEVNLVTSGGNYGWNIKEGSFCFNPNDTGSGFAFTGDPCPGETPELIDPIAEYNTSESLTENEAGRSVIGGFVYRGTRMPPLQGAYIFGDYSRFTKDGVNNDGSLFYLAPATGNTPRTVYEISFTDRERLGLALLGFAQDSNGEIYVLGNQTGTPFGSTGVVLRVAPTKITLSPSQDNTLFENNAGTTSSGAGTGIFVGKTNSGEIRRGLIGFDIAGSIPMSATITSAVLDLNMSKTIAESSAIALHRAAGSWGEGTSKGAGSGDAAAKDDATWLHRFYNTIFWEMPGGDYVITQTASTAVGGVGHYTWGPSTNMIVDVQGWLDVPESNHGWVLIGDETQAPTAKRFDSKESPSAANRPVLTVEYLPVPIIAPSLDQMLYLPLLQR